MHRETQAIVELGRELRSAGYHFVTVTPETHRRVLARRVVPDDVWARSLRDVFGWSRPFARDVLPPRMFELLQEARALEVQGIGFRSRLRFSSLGELLLAHSAFPTLDAESVFFGPDTYRFCRMLERWAPAADRAVDVGCGTGAGGLMLPGVRQVVLSDINARALAFAEANAALAGRQVSIVQSDVLSSVEGELSLVISNPPYLRDAARRTYRDGGGTYGEALSVRIVRESLDRLREGTLLIYTGAPIVNGQDQFFAAVQPYLECGESTLDYDYEELDPDVFGEELDQPGYEHVERIAAVGLRVHIRCMA